MTPRRTDDLRSEPSAEDLNTDLEAVSPESQTPAQDVLPLVNKVLWKGTKGKELNPKRFDAVEKADFDDADADPWQTHIRIGAIRIVPPDEAAKVDESRIL